MAALSYIDGVHRHTQTTNTVTYTQTNRKNEEHRNIHTNKQTQINTYSERHTQVNTQLPHKSDTQIMHKHADRCVQANECCNGAPKKTIQCSPIGKRKKKCRIKVDGLNMVTPHVVKLVAGGRQGHAGVKYLVAGGRQGHAGVKYLVAGGKQGHAGVKYLVAGGKQGHAGVKYLVAGGKQGHAGVKYLCINKASFCVNKTSWKL